MNSVNADFRKNLISSWNYFSGRCWSYIYSFLDIYTTSYLWEPGIIKPCIFFRQGRSGFTVYTANSNPLWISKYLEHILLSKLCKSCGGFFLPIIALNQFLRATNIIYWNWKQIMSVSQFLKCARRGTLFWNKSKCSKSKSLSFFNLNIKNEILEPQRFSIWSQ